MSYLDDLADIWEQVKESLCEKYPPSQMDLWFNPLKIHSFENNVIFLSTISEFKYTKIKEKYLGVIKEEFCNFFGFDQEVDIVFVGEPTDPEKIQRQLGLIRDNKPSEQKNSRGKRAKVRYRGSASDRLQLPV